MFCTDIFSPPILILDSLPCLAYIPIYQLTLCCFRYIALLFLLFGWAVLPFIYLMSFIFTVPSSGLVWLTMFNILSGMLQI